MESVAVGGDGGRGIVEVVKVDLKSTVSVVVGFWKVVIKTVPGPTASVSDGSYTAGWGVVVRERTEVGDE